MLFKIEKKIYVERNIKFRLILMQKVLFNYEALDFYYFIAISKPDKSRGRLSPLFLNSCPRLAYTKIFCIELDENYYSERVVVVSFSGNRALIIVLRLFKNFVSKGK